MAGERAHLLREDRPETWCGRRYCGADTADEVFSTQRTNCQACLGAYAAALESGSSVQTCLPFLSHFVGDGADHEIGFVDGVLVCLTCLDACFRIPNGEKGAGS